MSWQASSLIVLALALVAGFAWYERDKPPARVLALVATLAALAVVGRLAFAAIPNVKPTTDIVLFAGYALGAVPGFAVGAVTAVVSNVFLAQGPWTPWQMVGWGGVGVAGALIAWLMRGREISRWALAALCGLAGLAFGAWMDLYQLTLAAHQDLDTYLAISASSLPYNLAHAVGNVVFCLLIGPLFIRALSRYRRRLQVSWRAPAAASAAALALVLLLPAAALAASPADRAERWLLRVQNKDGGYGAAPKASSSELISGWSALGLAASGRNPRDVRRPGGRSLSTYVSRSAGALSDVGAIERTMLVLEAAGLSSRDFRGRDLVAALTRRRRSNGSIGGFVSYTAFGVIALRAAGASAGSSTVSWLVSAQNADGGFGLAPASASDSDITGAAVQALAVVGRARSAAARGAVAWLRCKPERRRGLRPVQGTQLQRAVHELCGAGARGGGRRRGDAVPVTRVPERPAALRRQHRLLVLEQPDAGVGDGAGADGARARAAAAGGRAAAGAKAAQARGERRRGRCAAGRGGASGAVGKRVVRNGGPGEGVRRDAGGTAGRGHSPAHGRPALRRGACRGRPERRPRR